MSQKQQINEYWQENETESFRNIAAHFSKVFNRTLSVQTLYTVIDPPRSRMRTPLSIYEQKQILQFSQKNSSLSVGKTAKHFTKLFRKKVTACVVSRIIRDSDKLSCLPDEEGLEEELMKEVFDETIARLGFSQSEVDSGSLPFFVTNDGIRSLALELASHEKFKGFFSRYKFGWRWIKKWREFYNVPTKPRSDKEMKQLGEMAFNGGLKEKPLREKLRCLKEKLLEENI